MLTLANILFFVFHTALIFFNLFGWAHPKTRKWNLITLLLTVFSWVVMGLWKGMGYCICTDWHWQIRRAMGIEETADSYLVLLVRNLSGWNPPLELVNRVAFVVIVVSLSMSVWTNVNDIRRKSKLTSVS
jgi:hypothetical protein